MLAPSNIIPKNKPKTLKLLAIIIPRICANSMKKQTAVMQYAAILLFLIQTNKEKMTSDIGINEVNTIIFESRGEW